MNNEYAILKYLQNGEQTTQRKIASRTGLSVGAVNLLLKKMVCKGLIKVERLNTRTMRYILTPQGMKEKVRLTYTYLRRSYRQIVNITAAVEELVQAHKFQGPLKQVILFGPADEVEQILISCLHKLGLPYQLWRPDQQPKPPQEDQLLLSWRDEEEEKLPDSNRAVNILTLI